jgi:hypothetical protein
VIVILVPQGHIPVDHVALIMFKTLITEAYGRIYRALAEILSNIKAQCFGNWSCSSGEEGDIYAVGSLGKS